MNNQAGGFDPSSAAFKLVIQPPDQKKSKDR